MNDTLARIEQEEYFNYQRMSALKIEVATLQNEIKRKDELIASANQLIEKLKQQLDTLNRDYDRLLNSNPDDPIATL